MVISAQGAPPLEDFSNGGWVPHSPGERAINFISLAINIVNICGNSFIFYLFATDRGLREARTFLILNLAVADFLWGGSAGFTELWNGIAGGFATGPAGCQAVLFLAALGIAVSMQTLMWISVDRWLHIVHERPSPSSVIMYIIALVWSVAISFATWLMLASRPAGGAIIAATHTYCDAPWLIQTPLMKSVAYFTLTCYVFFLTVMALCYGTIYRKFRRVRARIARLTVRSLGSATTGSSLSSQWSATFPNDLGVQRSKEDSAVSDVLELGVGRSSQTDRSERIRRRRERGHLMEQEQQEERAVVFKFVTLVAFFSVSWGFWVVGVVAYETFTNKPSPANLTGMGAIMAYTNSAANPLLFIFLDKRFMSSAKNALGLYQYN
ncbi:hypothetical protein SpCBS45565_g02142 [Spizellomyces sp. 'palustris']|nr:hypothetical protein SpCBS45565_g02142 [Spizellomyces sp. 'palustris']